MQWKGARAKGQAQRAAKGECLSNINTSYALIFLSALHFDVERKCTK